MCTTCLSVRNEDGYLNTNGDFYYLFVLARVRLRRSWSSSAKSLAL